MRHSTPKPTAQDERRFEEIKALGCIACLKERLPMQCGPTEAHHLLSGNKRRGHAQTIPLGRWHHRGIPWTTMNSRQMAMTFGPSLAKQSKLFRETYGDDNSLLAEVNRLIGSHL